MEREIITSRANPLLTRVRKLNSRRSFRREEGRFAAEGPKLLTEALRWGAELEAVIFATGVSRLGAGGGGGGQSAGLHCGHGEPPRYCFPL